MKGRQQLCGLVVIFAFAVSAQALDVHKSISQFAHTSWTAKDGVPGPIRAMAQTPDGYLWLGTEAGLYRFDGLRCVRWESRFGEQLYGAAVWSLRSTRDGSLWIGYGSGGVSRIQDGRVRNFPPDEGVPSGGVLSMVEDARGCLWAGGQYGLSKFEGGKWRRIGASEDFPTQGAPSLFVDRRGTLWAVTEGLNFRLTDDPVRRSTIVSLAADAERFVPTGEAVGMVWMMAEDAQGEVWIADTTGRSARRISGRADERRPIPLGDEPMCLLFDEQTLWIGLIEGGLRRPELSNDGKFDAFRASDGLSGGLVYCGLKDREGNLWFGTAGGLDRFRENKVTPFSAREGIDPDQQIALAASIDGSVSVVSYTRDAVRRFLNGHLTTSKLPAYSPNDTTRILSLAADAHGDLWVGGNFGLAKWVNGELSYDGAPQLDRPGNVEAIAHDASGSLWVAVSGYSMEPENTLRIQRYKDGHWTDFSAETELPKFRARVISADPQGRVWFGFEDGEVALLDGQTFHVYSAADGLPNGRILAITTDRHGHTWVGGEGGLSRLEAGRFVTLGRANGLPGDSVSGIVEDEAGDVWLASGLGILRVSHEELDKALASPSYRMQGLVVGGSDGLRGLPRQREPFPTAVRAANGQLWFATTGGVALIDPHHLPTNPVPPPITIEEVKADDHLLAMSLGQRVPPDPRELTFRFTALSLADSERVQFRYKLEGYDRDWSAPADTREVRYTNLPPRAYTFRVMAANNDGVWNEAGASWDFSIAPAFYETLWFKLVAGVAIIGLFVAWYRMRLRRVKRHNAALLQEVTERKRTESLLAAEKHLLEMVAARRPLAEILDAICQVIEEQRPGTLASVLLLSGDGIHLEAAGGPHIPDDWKREMSRLPIGPCAGSCGTAAFRKTAVIVSDIASDPLWEVPEHRGAALRHGLRASWSNPILSSDGTLLGTFCMYYRETKSPSAQDLELIELATHLTRVAIERHRSEEALRRSEGFLAEGQRISHTGSWSWDVATGNVTWSAEHYRIFGISPETKADYATFRQTVHPDDRARLDRDLDQTVRAKHEFDMEFRLALADGTIKYVQGVGRPVLSRDGEVNHYIGTTVDITARKCAELLLAGEKRLLEMVARGESLPCILDALCRLVEEHSIGALSSILLLDRNDKVLRHGAAPHLPQAYLDAIDRMPIGPVAGSCGTAAYHAKPVIVSNIATDPRWADFRDIALPHGLRACWSTPILSSDDKVLGTFAIYYREPRSPTAEQLEIIEQITHLASITLERKCAEEALRASEQLARGQVEALVQSLDVLATAPAPDQFITRMLSTMARLLKSEWVCLWLVDEKTDALVLRASVTTSIAENENDHPFVKDPHSWKTDPALQEIFFTGVPAAYEDIETDPRITEALREHLRRSGTKKLLRLPTLVGGEVKGFITLLHGERPPYRLEEIELAQALAHQAMLAIQSRQAATLEERNRMARDIHDTLAQGFTAIVVQLQAADDARGKGLVKDVEKHLHTALDLARQSLQEARRSVHALRPLALERRNFWEAFKDSVKRATAGTSLQTTVQVRGPSRELPVLWQENLLHIGLEALTNTLRYANAAHFQAHLKFTKNELRLDLHDDGDGFVPGERHHGFGLVGMHERVEQMGGSLTVTSAPQEGTTVAVSLPYN